MRRWLTGSGTGFPATEMGTSRMRKSCAASFTAISASMPESVELSGIPFRISARKAFIPVSASARERSVTAPVRKESAWSATCPEKLPTERAPPRRPKRTP